MNQLEIKDCNAHHKSLSQLDSNTSVNVAAYDHRQNKGQNSKKNQGNGKNQGQNKPETQGSSNSTCQSRKSPGMEAKCMIFGKQEHQPGQRCPAKNAKCKACLKIGHFHCICQSKKKSKQRVNIAQSSQDDHNYHTDENGVRQPNPPRVNMFRIVDHTEANMEERHLKFPIASHPKGPYKHNIEVRVDTGADVKCMNEMTFNKVFPEVQLSVCPHEIQNFRNLTADISILGQFHTYLEFRGVKYQNTFIVTNANDCPNLLSYGATFRMGLLLPNYPEENVVKGDNMPNVSKMNGGKNGNGTPHDMHNGILYASTGNGMLSGTANSTSNVLQILNDIQKRQKAEQYQYDSSTVSTVPVTHAPFRTTTPSAPATTVMTAEQVDSVHVHAIPVQNTSWSGPPAHCAHVHKPLKQVLKPGELLALRKVKHPHNGRTSVNRLPLRSKTFCPIVPLTLKVYDVFQGNHTNSI